MKEIKLTVVFLLFLVSEVHAQELTIKPRKFHFGLIGSINTSVLDINKNDFYGGNTSFTSENEPKIGYKIGTLVNYNISKYFFLSSGLSYQENKTKNKYSLLFSQDGSYIMIENFYSWIELPVNINYIINPKSTCKVVVGSGLSLRRILGATTSAKIQNNSNATSLYETSNNGSVKNWSLLGNVSIGVQLPISEKNSFLLSMSFEKSFFSIYDEPIPYQIFFAEYVGSDVRINTFNFNVAYLLK